MEGFLDKRSDSLLKGYQRRYFIRADDKLKYYLHKADLNGEARGIIPLTDLIDVYPADTEKTDRRFDMKFAPGSKTRADGLLQMKADSKIERDAWIDALKVWVNVKKFGHEQIVIPKRMFTGALACIRYCTESGHKVEGLFRVPGNAYSITEIFQYVCLYGEEYFTRKLIRSSFSVFDVSSALKKILREFPESILTFKLSDQFLQAKDKDSVKLLLSQLPKRNEQVLSGLVKLCAKLVEYTEKTKLSATSLAVCLGPCLISAKKELAFVNFLPLFEIFLEHAEELFPNSSENDEKESTVENSQLGPRKSANKDNSVRLSPSKEPTRELSMSQITPSERSSYNENGAEQSVRISLENFSGIQSQKVQKATTWDISAQEVLNLAESKEFPKNHEEKRESFDIPLYDVMEASMAMDDMFLRTSEGKKPKAITRRTSSGGSPAILDKMIPDSPKQEEHGKIIFSAPVTDGFFFKNDDEGNSVDTVVSRDLELGSEDGVDQKDSISGSPALMHEKRTDLQQNEQKKQPAAREQRKLPPTIIEELHSASVSFKASKALFEKMEARHPGIDNSQAQSNVDTNTIGQFPKGAKKRLVSNLSMSTFEHTKLALQNRQLGMLMKEIQMKVRDKSFESLESDLEALLELQREMDQCLSKYI